MTNKNSKQDIFGDDYSKTDSQDFASLLAQADTPARALSVGDSIRGEVLSIGKEESFVSTGTPTDGIILTRDLLDENKLLKFKVGDLLDVIVTRIKGGEILLTRKGAAGSSHDIENLEDAYDMEVPIEGKVLELCNGGFRVQLHGQGPGKLSFCPVSQMDFRVLDQNEYIGKKYDFIITQFSEKGRNIVVSRRRVLDLQRAENEGSFLLKHEIGKNLTGRITRLERFGAFVELEPGIEGLIHISELAWSRVHSPEEVIKPNQLVTVKLLKIEELDGRLKISLSLKQAGDSSEPWLKVPSEFPVGTIINGTVEKKEPFGLFVNLAPGITGLLPKSKWRDSTEPTQFENKKRGDQISVRVEQILFEERKLSLGIPGSEEDTSWQEHKTEVKGFGSGQFGDLQNLFKKK